MRRWDIALATVIGLAASSSSHTQEFVGLHAADASRDLDVNGRMIPLRFGAAEIGYSAALKNGSVLVGALGRGYDRNVRSSFLSIDANGPAVCDVIRLGVSQPLYQSSQWTLDSGLEYRMQRVQADLAGVHLEDSFRGEVVLRTHYLTPMLTFKRLLHSQNHLFVQAGALNWHLSYHAYGEIERAKVWTQSGLHGWAPAVGVGGMFDLFIFRVVAQITAYRLNADNKVWVPGVSFVLTR